MPELDSDQAAVVGAPNSPLLVVAGAGSGKTRTLIHRIAHLIDSGIHPERVLLLTFTQRAAHDMTSRLERRFDQPFNFWAGTFHGIGVRLLRAVASHIGYRDDFTVLDRWSSARLFSEVLHDWTNSGGRIDSTSDALQKVYSLSINSDRELAGLLADTPNLRSVCLDSLNDVLTEYVAAKFERNVMDYDDLLTYWQLALHQSQELADSLRERFDVVLVDEYQDVNPLQADIVDQMVVHHRNITAVGDDYQSIYAFRGAHVAAMLSFEERYPDATILPLRSNYRSTPEIVALSRASIRQNHYQRHKDIVSRRGHGPRPIMASFDDTEVESQFVAARIEALFEHGVPYEEQAVLYRTHAQSKAVQLALQSAGIPFVVRSGPKFLDQPHIRPLVWVLRALSNPLDHQAWTQILGVFDGLGPVATQGILSIIFEHDSPWESFADPSRFVGLSVRFRQPFEKARQVLCGFWNRSDEGAVEQLLFLIHSEYMDAFIGDDSRGDSIASDFDALIALASQTESLKVLLDRLVIDPAIAHESRNESGSVTVSTIHQAKGLEWAAVLVIGLSEGVFPLWSTMESQMTLEEERRLFYVAVTRAQRFLYLCHPWCDTKGAHGVTMMPSRFLTEVQSSVESPVLEHWNGE